MGGMASNPLAVRVVAKTEDRQGTDDLRCGPVHVAVAHLKQFGESFLRQNAAWTPEQLESLLSKQGWRALGEFQPPSHKKGLWCFKGVPPNNCKGQGMVLQLPNDQAGAISTWISKAQKHQSWPLAGNRKWVTQNDAVTYRKPNLADDAGKQEDVQEVPDTLMDGTQNSEDTQEGEKDARMTDNKRPAEEGTGDCGFRALTAENAMRLKGAVDDVQKKVPKKAASLRTKCVKSLENNDFYVGLDAIQSTEDGAVPQNPEEYCKAVARANRSGSGYWDLELAVGARLPIGFWDSRFRSGSAQCDLELADEGNNDRFRGGGDAPLPVMPVAAAGGVAALSQAFTLALRLHFPTLPYAMRWDRQTRRCRGVALVFLAAALSHGPLSWTGPSGERDIVKWATEKLQRNIPDIHHLAVQDVSDGHTSDGFFDGSGRSRHPDGKELKVLIVSDAFDTLSMLDRQRLVHMALKEGLRSNAIHALPSLQTLTLEQWQNGDCKDDPKDRACSMEVSFEDLDHNVVDVKLPEGSGAP
eukprot:s951_g6.t1